MYKPIARGTAESVLSNPWKLYAALAALAAITYLWPLVSLSIIALAILYFELLIVSLKILVPLMSGKRKPDADVRLSDRELPKYTVMFALYKEANMIGQIEGAVRELDYPKHLLQAMLVLEEGDTATIAAARAASLPPYWQIVIVPRSQHLVNGRALKGKPRALNYASQFARGEYLVVYDAEDIPDPQQLRKAVNVFRTSDRDLACVQAQLNFNHNADANWVTRIMWAEYAWHFGYFLRGLDNLGLVIPLGGTSNHLKMETVRRLAVRGTNQPRGEAERGALGIWDAFNVTEDCDLGGWLYAHGYTVKVIDSQTDEEAPVTLTAAFNQRTRWVKGYAQTALVFMRHPLQYSRNMGSVSYLTFLMTSGGSFLALLIAPALWLTALYWFADRPEWLQQAFAAPAIAQIAVWSAVLGNLLLLATTLFIAISTRKWKTALSGVLMPVWWIMLSFAAWQALRELLTGRAQFWNKTAHGVQLPGKASAGASVAVAEITE